MKIFRNTFYIILIPTIISFFIILKLDINVYPKIVNYCISANVTCIFLLVSNFIGYSIEKQKTKVLYYEKFSLVCNNYINFFNTTKKSSKLKYLNKAKDDFNEFLDSFDNFYFMVSNKKLRKKLIEPIIYIQIINKFIFIDLCMANLHSDNKNYQKRDKNIDFISNKLEQTFETNKTIVNILLNDLLGYKQMLATGINGRYLFKNKPDGKTSLQILIKEENEEIHCLLEEFKKHCLNANDLRILYDVNKIEQKEFEKKIQYLINTNYIDKYDNLSERMKISCSILRVIPRITYDLLFTEKIINYFESLDEVNTFNF